MAKDDYAVMIKDGFNETAKRMESSVTAISELAAQVGARFSIIQVFNNLNLVAVTCDVKFAKRLRKLDCVASVKADV